MPHYGAASSGDCIPCKVGYLCDSEGIASPVGCPTGYSCEEGSSSITSSAWPGEYCPENCPVYLQCPWGTYSTAYL
jgi:hypothetical protein